MKNSRRSFTAVQDDIALGRMRSARVGSVSSPIPDITAHISHPPTTLAITTAQPPCSPSLNAQRLLRI